MPMRRRKRAWHVSWGKYFFYFRNMFLEFSTVFAHRYLSAFMKEGKREERQRELSSVCLQILSCVCVQSAASCLLLHSETLDKIPFHYLCFSGKEAQSWADPFISN